MVKAAWFKYFKNMIIGLGASAVMIGALGKINSEPWGGLWITIGLIVEASIFFMLGVIPPEKDYYWEKLYPGLENYKSNISPITEGDRGDIGRPLNGEVVENQIGGMLSELQSMSKSMSSLKALQEVDFSQTSDQIKSMGNFYQRMNDAMSEMSATVEDTKEYRAQLIALNKNIGNVNKVYQSVAESREHVERMNESMREMGNTIDETMRYKAQLVDLNANLKGLNGVYGNVLSAMSGGAK